MKLKVQHVMESMEVLTAIINRAAPMPQRGKFLLARMHTKLRAEYETAYARREAMIKEYATPRTDTAIDAETKEVTIVPVEGQWMVPADKLKDYEAAWKVIGDEEIEVDVQAIPLVALSLPNGTDGAIQAVEMVKLGDLIVDTAN